MSLKLNRRSCILELGEEYGGAEVRCRLDVDLGVFFGYMALDNSNPEAVRVAMKEFAERILISWDITDEDGSAIPASEEGMLRLPPELAFRIVQAWANGVATVPLVSAAPSPNGSMLVAVPEATGQ